MKSKEYKTTQIIANAVCGIFTLCAVIPFFLLIAASFTDNSWAVSNGFSFFPGKLSLEAYEYIAVQWGVIGKAYLMTLVVTGAGTVLSLGISTLFAYSISHKEIPGMKVLNFLLIFTMLFNGGLVSTYYSYVNLYHMKNTIFALIIPNLLMNAFNVILIKNYFLNSIPESLLEAARIDGASELKIFMKIVIPLSKPIIATVCLLTALAYWNDWQNGLYYLTDRGGAHLYTIQNVMNNINENLQVLLQNASQAAAIGANASQMPSTTIRMAIAVVGILPLLALYPFFQKYFVKGITLGGVKE